MKNLLDFYENETNVFQKRTILSLVSSQFTLRELNLRGWGVGKTAFTSSRGEKSDGPPSVHSLENNHQNGKTKQIPTPKMKLRFKKNQKVDEAVTDFYESHSHPAGNQLCYNKAQKDFIPVRVRNETKKRLHRDFVNENPDVLVSYSKFARLQPKNVRQAKRKLDMCEICVRGEEVVRESDKRARLRVEEAEGSGSSDFDKTIEENKKIFEAHKCVVDSQREEFKKQKQMVKPGEALVIIDFKENLKLGSGPVEVGNDFYSKSQVTCLGFAVYLCSEDGSIVTHYFDFISYCLSHDAFFAKQCLAQLIPKIQNKSTQPLHTMTFWLDCGPHFRCYEFLHFLLKEIPQKYANIQTTMANFFAPHHGKSPVDAHFSHISKSVKSFTTKHKLTHIEQLKNAIDIYFANSSSIVEVIIFECPQRGDKFKLQLKSKKDNSLVCVKKYFCFGFFKGSFLCSILSDMSGCFACEGVEKKEEDKRKNKMPPELEERTKEKVFSFSDCIVGNGTKSMILETAIALKTKIEMKNEKKCNPLSEGCWGRETI